MSEAPPPVDLPHGNPPQGNPPQGQPPHGNPPQGQPRRRPSTGRRVLIGVLVFVGVLVVGAGLLAGAFTWSFAGGWDGIRPEADPGGRKATAARAEATAALPARQQELDALLAPVAREPLARGTVDGCRRGQNNWKIHDGYTLRCQTAVVAVYPWTSTQESLDQLKGALADGNYTTAYPEAALSTYGPNGYADGQYSAGGTELHLQVTPAGEDPLISPYYPGDDAYRDARVDDIDAAARSAQPTLTVIATRTYFED